MRTLSSFDHRHNRLDLDAVAVGRSIEAGLHQPTIPTRGWLVGGPTMLGRNERADIVVIAGKPMIGLGVVASIGSHQREANPLESVGNERTKLVYIGSRTAASVEGQNEMIARIADHAQFGIAMINDCFPGTSDLFAAANEVRTRRPALQTRGINCGGRDASASAHLLPDGRVQQAPGRLRGEQSSRGFLQRCEVGNTFEFHNLNQCRVIGQVGDNASIVGLEEVLQYQAGEELMLRKHFGTVSMRIGR